MSQGMDPAGGGKAIAKGPWIPEVGICHQRPVVWAYPWVKVHIILAGLAATLLNQVFLTAGVAAVRANIGKATWIDLPAAPHLPFKLRGLRLGELRGFILCEVPGARRRAGPASGGDRRVHPLILELLLLALGLQTLFIAGGESCPCPHRDRTLPKSARPCFGAVLGQFSVPTGTECCPFSVGCFWPCLPCPTGTGCCPIVRGPFWGAVFPFPRGRDAARFAVGLFLAPFVPSNGDGTLVIFFAGCFAACVSP